MNSRYDLSHICFEGKATARPPELRGGGATQQEACGTVLAERPPASQEQWEELIAWIMGRAGLDAAAYRPQPLARRFPACLRALKVRSPRAARQLLERRPHLVLTAVSSLLIGVTEFFREPEVFDFLSARVLRSLAAGNRWPRIWSAACSSGAELYSMAILLSEAGLLERSYLLGSDCRGDAIERARLGVYDASLLKLVPRATRDKYFQRDAETWRTVEALRRQVHWKVADLLGGVEAGPWDIIFWRNTAIYLNPRPAETTWRRLAAALAPQGLLIAGKADRPPADAGLTHVARCVYRVAAYRDRPPSRSVSGTDALNAERHGGRSLQAHSHLAKEHFP